MAKNKAAQELGRLGGRARTPAKVAASRANWAKHRGRPVEYRIERVGWTGTQILRRIKNRHAGEPEYEPVSIWTPQVLRVLATWITKHRPGDGVKGMGDNGHVYFWREE